MNFLEKIIASLSGTMTTPLAYGWFHLMFFGIMVVFTIFMGIIFKNKSDKSVNIVVLIYAVVCLILELYKQLLFSYNSTANQWSYQWYAFPFQFCSTPMYVALIASLLKKGKVKDSLQSFLATFGLLGGLLVMVSPGDVFTSQIGINIQTMVHHGGQFFIGAFLMITKKVKLDFKTPLRALPTFAALVAVALTLNLSLTNLVNGATFNMFFISPYFPSTLPVFSIIYEKVPYIIFLFIYIIGFTLGAYVISLFSMFVRWLKNVIKKLINKNSQHKNQKHIS